MVRDLHIKSYCDYGRSARPTLLAVAPDKGADLDFSIDPAAKGDPPKVVESTRHGVHQYADGRHVPDTSRHFTTKTKWQYSHIS